MAQNEFDTRWNVRDGLWSENANWVFDDGSEAEPPSAGFDESAWIGNGGTANVDSSAPDFVKLSIANGTVHVQQGGSLNAVDSENQDATGPSSIGNNSTLRLSGNGSLSTVDLNNNGTIALDSVDSNFHVTGGFNHQGTLALNITSAGTPKVTVDGAATLAGTIEANFDNSVNLAFGDSFEFLSGASSVANDGAQVVAPPTVTLDRGLSLQLGTTNSTAAITLGNLPVLTMHRATGEASISNVVGGPLTMTSYDISSDLGLLSPEGWSSLNSQGNADWTPANPRTNQIAELNLTGELTLEVDQSINVGNPYNGGATHPNDEDVRFQFSTPDGRILDGLVEYTGPPNDLVLNVNPETGEVTLQNLSTFVGDIEIVGYNILSPSGSLDPQAFTGLGEPGWSNAGPMDTGLAEISLEASKVFSGGTAVSLGTIFKPGGTQDLVLEFGTPGFELLIGTVEYGVGGVGPVPGDCNGDGVVDAGDLACVSTIEERDIVLAAIPTLAGDLDGNGDVAFPDFLVLSANFGQDLPSYTAGNIDLAGGVAFPDFLVLSANFGKTPGATAAAVPEPGGLSFLTMAGAALLGFRRRRHAYRNSRTSVGSQRTHQMSLFLIAGLCLSMLISARTIQAESVLGTGTSALLGGDLTDPEDDGDPEADTGYNATFRANEEEGFGGGEFAFNVFDNVLGPSNDKWCCGPGGGIPAEGLWVEAQLDTGPYFLTSFTVSSANDVPDRDPTHWAIQGSNDAVNYDTIYEHNGGSFWDQRLQVVRFSAGDDFPEQETPYQIFRHVTFNTASNPNGAYFQIGEIEFFGSLQAVTPGDFNGDGAIDTADFNILAANYGTGNTFEQGDINRDFIVDLRDFVNFREVFASQQGATAAAVPEPSSLALLCLTGSVLLAVSRKGRRRRANSKGKGAHSMVRCLSMTAAVLAVLQISALTSSAQLVISQSNPEYLAFEAEQFDSLTGDPATGFLLLTAEDPLELDSGVLVPDPDSNAVGIDGPVVMFDQLGGPQTDLVNYKLNFSEPGPYFFYLRYSLYDMNADGAYGNEDSVFYPRDFGMDPSGPLSDFNYWGYTPSGTPNFPAGQQGQPLEGNYMWVRGSDNSNNSVGWEYEPTLNTVLDWAVAARENGTTLDRFVFSTNPDLTAEELDEIPSFLPLPPGATLGDFNDDGAIDAADFQIIAENFHQRFTFEEAFFHGDMNGNLRIEMQDFLAFRELYSMQQGGGAGAAVPEPAVLTLLGFGLAVATHLLRRRRT